MPEGSPIPGVTISRERAESIIRSAFDAAVDAHNRADFEEVGRQAAVIGEISYAIQRFLAQTDRERDEFMPGSVLPKPKRPLKLLVIKNSVPELDPVVVRQAIADADLVVDLRVGRVTKWREGSEGDFEMDWI